MQQLENVRKDAHRRDVGAGTWSLHDERRARVAFGGERDDVVAAFRGGDRMLARELLQAGAGASFFERAHIPEHGAWLAQFHYQQGDPIKALEILSDALRHCPDNALLKEVRSDVLEYVQLDERDD